MNLISLSCSTNYGHTFMSQTLHLRLALTHLPYFFDQMLWLLFISQYIWCCYYSRAGFYFLYKPSKFCTSFDLKKKLAKNKTIKWTTTKSEWLQWAWFWVIWRLQQSFEIFDNRLLCYRAIHTWHFQSILLLSSPCDFTRRLSQKVSHFAWYISWNMAKC